MLEMRPPPKPVKKKGPRNISFTQQLQVCPQAVNYHGNYQQCNSPADNSFLYDVIAIPVVDRAFELLNKAIEVCIQGTPVRIFIYEPNPTTDTFVLAKQLMVRLWLDGTHYFDHSLSIVNGWQLVELRPNDGQHWCNLITYHRDKIAVSNALDLNGEIFEIDPNSLPNLPVATDLPAFIPKARPRLKALLFQADSSIKENQAAGAAILEAERSAFNEATTDAASAVTNATSLVRRI